jgi:plastocyanin
VEQVDLYDDYFKPSLMVVPVGTTVQWMNHGRHHHTATSNAGLWDSGHLRPGGGSYSVTFTERGVYYYFCAMHPREMRGIVQVTGSGGGNYGGSSRSHSGSTSGY